jgi:pimeloyl-ACP methyl ester carboxylesterase
LEEETTMRTVTSKDGTTIAFDQMGQGPSLILVGGATTTRIEAASVAAALASYFTVFAYDRRGRGDSGDTPPYAVEREIEDIESLLDEAGGTAFLYGHSSGAILALEAALLLPAKVTKLALYEPPFIIDDSRAPVGDMVSSLNALLASGRRGEAVEYFMTCVGTPGEMMVQMRQSPMWPRLEAVAPTLAYDATIAQDTEQGDPRSLRKWMSLTIPTLILDGTVFFGCQEDHEFMRHGADELARVLPAAQRRTLEGQDHGPSNETLVPALKEFFLS